MVIFFNMIVKKISKVIYTLSIIFLFYLFLVPFVEASSPSVSFYPSGGVIKDVDEGFTIDILVDSGDYELVQASVVFTFDPRQLQVVEANRNNSLFEQWPEDESTLDNENGVVMLTGFTQSGSGELYQTEGDPDVIARIEFEVITDDLEAEIPLTWEYDNTDDLFQTALLEDGSPPQNVLEDTPSDVVFTVTELTQTAVDPRYVAFIVGGLLILLAGVIITSRPEFTRKKYGTVVVYDE